VAIVPEQHGLSDDDRSLDRARTLDEGRYFDGPAA
jgi:hypothetical protein